MNFNLSSELNIKGSISQANVNLYLPRNNDVDRSVVDVTFDNFDIAPLGDYLRQYLPNGLSDIRGIINVRIDKKNLQAVLDNCAVIMKDSAKSIILPDTLNINSKFNLTSKVINFEYVDVFDKLIGEDGQLSREYTVDGIHLQENAYDVVAAIIYYLMEG